MRVAHVILAAGKGTRMKSRLPKVLHPILGKPMILYAVDTARQISPDPPVVVVGHGADQVRATVGERAQFVYQEKQLGTAHAVLQARSLLECRADVVLVTYGDMPLLRVETLQRLLQEHARTQATITMLTAVLDDPHGYGRVLRDAAGNVIGIVEEADATPEQRAIRELNVGIYAFDAAWLWDNLPRISPSPVKGEYYLTDAVALAVQQGRRVTALTVEDTDEILGVNTRVHLAEVTRVLQRRINEHWMLEGVTMVDPDTAYIGPDVSLEPDVVLHPQVTLLGQTHVGEGTEIGPGTYILSSQIGRYCRIFYSVLEHAVVEDEVDIGPFGHLRKGAHLARGVHMGNFGEVKNSYLGPGTKMGHFSYIGDAQVGANVNIGAGTITCNYDGERKHRTIIEDDVFIGSDTMLVAPVRIGRGAKTGAGSVVTRDIPPYTLAYGVPARPRRTLAPAPEQSGASHEEAGTSTAESSTPSEAEGT